MDRASDLAIALPQDIGSGKVRRHGAILAVDTEDGSPIVLLERRAWTKRGARRAFASCVERIERVDREPIALSLRADGAPSTFTAALGVAGRVVACRRSSPGEGPDIGVREPRRPRPPSGCAGATLLPDRGL